LKLLKPSQQKKKILKLSQNKKILKISEKKNTERTGHLLLRSASDKQRRTKPHGQLPERLKLALGWTKLNEISSYRIMKRRGTHLRQFCNTGGGDLGWRWQGCRGGGSSLVWAKSTGKSLYLYGILSQIVANSDSNPYISKIASNCGEVGLNRMGKFLCGVNKVRVRVSA
jgi:hypothetical protein